MNIQDKIGPTTDHNVILQWAATRNAYPVEYRNDGHDGEPGHLHFLFESAAPPGPNFHRLTWDTFFTKFNLLGLSFVAEGGRGYELLQMEEDNSARYIPQPN